MLATAGVLFAPTVESPAVPRRLPALAMPADGYDTAVTEIEHLERPVANHVAPSIERATSPESIVPWTRKVPTLTIDVRDERGAVANARIVATPERAQNGFRNEHESLELGASDGTGLLRVDLNRACSLLALRDDGACSRVARFAPGDESCTLWFESTRTRRVRIRDVRTGQTCSGVDLAFLDTTQCSGVWLRRTSDDEGWLAPDLPAGIYWVNSVDERLIVQPAETPESTPIQSAFPFGDPLVVAAAVDAEPIWIEIERFDTESSLRLRVLGAETGAPLPRAAAGFQIFREDRGIWFGGSRSFHETEDGWLEVGGITKMPERFPLRIAVDAPGRRRAIVDDPRARIASGLDVIVPLELDPDATPGAIEVEIGDAAIADAIACCRGTEEFAAGEFEDGTLRFAGLTPGDWLVGPYDLLRFARYSASGLEHLPLHRITLAAGEMRRITWDPRWTPTDRLVGRVIATGIDPARLHIVADHGPLGAKIHLARDMRRVAVAADATFEFRDLVALPLRFLAVLVEPSGHDRILAEGPVDRPLLVECGSIEIDVTGIADGETAFVELICGPGLTEVSLPTRLSLRIQSGAPLRVDDLPVSHVAYRRMKAPHHAMSDEWTALAIESGRVRSVTVLAEK
jgi:hypothetical protein